MKRTRRVTPLRYAFGVSVIAAWCGAMVYASRLTSAHTPIVAVVAAILFTVPLTSLGEWLVHGVLYHGRIPGLEFIRTIHHHGHHFALFPPQRYVQKGKFPFMRFRAPLTPFQMSDNAWDNFLTMYSQVGLHFVVGIPLILVPAWLATKSVAFVGGATFALAAISWLLGYVHGVIHTPGDRAIEHMRWFQWLDRHHYIHHVDLSANINFMLPVCDFLFGTQKWSLTEKEAQNHPSFEASKPMAKDIPPRVGEGEEVAEVAPAE